MISFLLQSTDTIINSLLQSTDMSNSLLQSTHIMINSLLQSTDMISSLLQSTDTMINSLLQSTDTMINSLLQSTDMINFLLLTPVHHYKSECPNKNFWPGLNSTADNCCTTVGQSIAGTDADRQVCVCVGGGGGGGVCPYDGILASRGEKYFNA